MILSTVLFKIDAAVPANLSKVLLSQTSFINQTQHKVSWDTPINTALPGRDFCAFSRQKCSESIERDHCGPILQEPFTASNEPEFFIAIIDGMKSHYESVQCQCGVVLWIK